MLRAALVAVTLAQNVRPPEGGSQPDARVDQNVTIYKVGGLAAEAADCAEVTFQQPLPVWQGLFLVSCLRDFTRL